MQVSIQRVPRVYFRLELPSARRARRQIMQMLERHLSANFSQVRRFSFNILPVSQLMLIADGNNFIVTLGREKRRGQDDRAWLFTINPLDYPVPIRNLPKHEERKYLKGLMLVSVEIEKFLTNMRSVTRQAWFFEGWEAKKPGVRTPAELPWQVEGPEHSGTENQTLS